MTDDAWKTPARHAVERLAQRCIDHPQIGRDPECVIATERERMLREIDAAPDTLARAGEVTAIPMRRIPA